MDDDHSRSPNSVLYIGIGLENNWDSAIGLVIARVLRTRRLPNPPEIIEFSQDNGLALLEEWTKTTSVIMFGAISSNKKPGTIERLTLSSKETIPSYFFHLFSISELLTKAAELDKLPSQIVLYGIEGEDFDEGIGLSESVALAAQKVLKQIIQD